MCAVRRASLTRPSPVVMIAALTAVLRSYAWATTASDICAATANPCIVNTAFNITSGSFLDFGTRQLTITSNGALNLQASPNGSTMSIRAGVVVIQASGRIKGDAPSAGSIIVEGSSIDVAGTISAVGDTGSVLLNASAGPLRIGGLVDVTSGGGQDGGSMVLLSAGDLVLDSTASGVVLKGDIGSSPLSLIAAGDVEIRGRRIEGGDVTVRAGYDVGGHGYNNTVCFNPSESDVSSECGRRFGDVRLTSGATVDGGAPEQETTIDIEGCDVTQEMGAELRSDSVSLTGRNQLAVHGKVVSAVEQVTLTYRGSQPDASGACFTSNFGGGAPQCGSVQPTLEQNSTLVACSCSQAVCPTIQCFTNACDMARGCVYSQRPGGSACDDGNACTTSDGCFGPGCGGIAVNCDDGNQCTIDGCDPTSGCTRTMVNCDDGKPCTVDACSPVSGCTHTVSCDDGSACTVDGCNGAGACVHTTINCADSNSCTVDGCNPAIGCTHPLTPLCQAGVLTVFDLLLAPRKCPLSPATDCATPVHGDVKLRKVGSGSLRWRFKGGPSVDAVGFGDPTASTTFALCLYDGGVLALEAVLEPSATLWRTRGSGHRYKDSSGTQDGVTQAKLSSSASTGSKLQVSGKGIRLPLPTPVSATQMLNVAGDVQVQLHQTGGACFDTTFGLAQVFLNSGTTFSARF